MVPLGREKHAPYRFDFLFRTCDIAQCIYTIQKFVFEFAAAVGLITSDRYLPAAAKALCKFRSLNGDRNVSIFVYKNTC